jgi:hypothetical protein
MAAVEIEKTFSPQRAQRITEVFESNSPVILCALCGESPSLL